LWQDPIAAGLDLLSDARPPADALVNLIGHVSVQVGDERRSLGRDARRCDRMRAGGVIEG
jgi:hypothetical protein